MAFSLRPQGSGAVPGSLDRVEMSGGVLTVGRGEENDIVLPDPDRHISKRHFVIEDRGGDYFLIDLSTNGTFLNHSANRIGDQPMPLTHGDVITLGRYELVVEIADGAADPFGAAHDPLADLPPPLEQTMISQPVASRQRHDPNPEIEDPLAGDDDLLGLLDSPLSGQSPRSAKPMIPEDPLGGPDAPLIDGDDPLGPPPAGEDDWLTPTRAADADHSPSASDAFRAPSASNMLIPDDFDADLDGGFNPPPARPAPPPPAAAPAARQAPAAAPFLPPGGDDEDPFGDEPFEVPTAPAEPAAAGPAGLPPVEADDLDSLLDAPPPQPAPPPRAAAPVPPPRTAPPPPPARPAPTAAAASSGGEAAARAFLRAAGAEHIAISDAELVETMERIGIAFRTMVEGMREVLMTRKSIKDEFRVSQTQIQAGGNNPLKFSISPEQAVEAMIKPTVRGYLRADEAAAQALKDIKAHEVAMMSGMEAAFKAILARLDPQALTGRIEVGGGLGSLLSGKKSRYWEVYEKMYGDIAREAEDDFQTLFGREFARAYEEQLRKL